MKKFKRLSTYKKKRPDSHAAVNLRGSDPSFADKQQSARTKIFSKKRFSRSQSLSENAPTSPETSLNGCIQNGDLEPRVAAKSDLSSNHLLNRCGNAKDQFEYLENNNNNDAMYENGSANKSGADYNQSPGLCETDSMNFQSLTDCNDLDCSNSNQPTNSFGVRRSSSDQTEMDQSLASSPPSDLHYHNYLLRELKRLAQQGWYWGPLSRTEAEEKLVNMSDGSFLVRDSADERYLLSLSFRSFGRTLHTRIEHTNGKFSFYADGDRQSYSSVVDLIEDSIKHSQHSGVFCYSRFRAPSSPTLPVRLTHPVSRLSQVRSLQYLCRFVIRQYTRIDHVQELPLPNAMKGYVNQSYF